MRFSLANAGDGRRLAEVPRGERARPPDAMHRVCRSTYPFQALDRYQRWFPALPRGILI